MPVLIKNTVLSKSHHRRGPEGDWGHSLTQPAQAEESFLQDPSPHPDVQKAVGLARMG